MKFLNPLSTGWKKAIPFTGFSRSRGVESDNTPNIPTSEVDSFTRQTQASSSKTTTSDKDIRAQSSISFLSQSPQRKQTCSELDGITYLELVEKARDLVLGGLWGESGIYEASRLCSQIIIRYPESLDLYVMRSVVRAKLGDLKGAIEDCNTILRINPDNEYAILHRVSLLQDSRIRTTSTEGIEKILNGVKFAQELGTTPYSIVLKHAGLPRLKPSRAHIKEVEDLVTAVPTFRCAKIVLISMYFARFRYTGDASCKAEAIHRAIEVQKYWPDDKTAMSVLWYLQGTLGQGCLSRSHPRGYNFILQDALYPKESIRADVLFCFSLEEQDKEIKHLIENIASRK